MEMAPDAIISMSRHAACLRPQAAPPDPVGKVLAELARPLPHALVAHDNAGYSQHLLGQVLAEREAEIQPDGVVDGLGREMIAGVAGGGGRCHPVRLRDLACHSKPPTSRCPSWS